MKRTFVHRIKRCEAHGCEVKVGAAADFCAEHEPRTIEEYPFGLPAGVTLPTTEAAK